MSSKIGTFIIQLEQMDKVKLIPIDADLPMEENDENFKPVVEKNEKEVPEMTHKKIPKKRVRKLKNIFNKKTKKVNVK